LSRESNRNDQAEPTELVGPQSEIFEDRELAPEATIKHFLIVRTEGNRSISRTVDHYSLPVVIAIGYRSRPISMREFAWAREWRGSAVMRPITMKGAG
jgi:hypothetical protein